MKYVLVVLLIACVAPASRAGFFDQLKKSASDAAERRADKEIHERVDSVGRDQPQKARQEETNNAKDAGKTQAPEPIASVDDLYGRWEGGVEPAKGSIMDRVSLDIVITPETASMRAQAAGTSCLAELTPTGTLGQYDAVILTQQDRWGTRATVAIADGGRATVDWVDSPDTPAEKRVYHGQLERKLVTHPREQWSVSGEQRRAFDIVGFTLGMTYEQALDYGKAEHPDLEPSLNIVRDAEGGAKAIVCVLKEKGARRYGGDFLGEQVALGFESQTAEEMQVEQDPEVMARIAERDTAIEARAKAQQDMNRQRRSRSSREDSASEQADLPEIPEMPDLRPEGADGELLYISRSVMFTDKQGPHKDKVVEALTAKYGPPSIEANPQSMRMRLGWVFDASGKRVADATGGPCDHVTQQPSAMKDRDKFYSVALTAGQAGGAFDLVTVSSECGLMLKAQIEFDGRSGTVRRVTTTVYDAQRLLGDEWYRTTQLAQASIANEKAKTEAIQSRDVPDF